MDLRFTRIDSRYFRNVYIAEIRSVGPSDYGINQMLDAIQNNLYESIMMRTSTRDQHRLNSQAEVIIVMNHVDPFVPTNSYIDKPGAIAKQVEEKRENNNLLLLT